MWFNDDEYEDENGANSGATNSASGQAATSPGSAVVSQSTSLSPSGPSQQQQSSATSTTPPSAGSGMANASSPGKYSNIEFWANCSRGGGNFFIAIQLFHSLHSFEYCTK